MTKPILKLTKFNIFTFDQHHSVLNDVALTIDENQFYVVTGQNGAGKSSLLSVIQSEVQKFHVEGNRHTDIAFIPLLSQQIEHFFVGQSPREELILAYESVNHADIVAVSEQQMDDALELVVNELNMESYLHKPIHELSGGQQQLAALASVLLVNSPLILIDEMTTMLDVANRRSILTKIRKMQKITGCSILYVTHDENEIIPSDQIIYVENGHATQFTYGEWSKLVSEISANNVDDEQHDLVLPLLDRGEIDSHELDDASLVVSSIATAYTRQYAELTYTFHRGKLTWINGENGAGKSTLLKTIAGDERLTEGQIQFVSESTHTLLAVGALMKGRNSLKSDHSLRGGHSKKSNNSKLASKETINAVKRSVSYCPQFLTHYWSKETVLEECIFVLQCYNLLTNFKNSMESEAYICAYLSYFGLEHNVLQSRIYTLSVGQQRKLALALCFMSGTNWLLLDEPYAYLDTQTKKNLTKLIEQRVMNGVGVILISHEPMTINSIKIETIIIEKQVESVESLNYEERRITEKSSNKLTEQLAEKLHPLILLAMFFISSILIFLFASVIELLVLFVVLLIVLSIAIRDQMRQLIKMIVIFSVYMCFVGLFITIDFTSWQVDVDRLISFYLYTFKLIFLIMLAYPIMIFISPFRLMRALQQTTKRCQKLKGEYLYSVVILFKFIVLLQQLWSTLIVLYDTKYKMNITKSLISFFVHYVREALLIAESIIINYELRKPMNANLLLYKVNYSKLDYIIIISTLSICLLIVVV